MPTLGLVLLLATGAIIGGLVSFMFIGRDQHPTGDLIARELVIGAVVVLLALTLF